MRPNRFVTVLVMVLTATASTVRAQEAADPVMPRVGSWGAEVVFGGGTGANVLRFSSPNAAWLAGLSFNLSHQTEEVPTFVGDIERSSRVGAGDARLGRRWWNGERGEQVRRLTGLGVLGGATSNTGFRSWNVGGYGELGASYFVSPHLSLGANSELALVYARETFSGGGDRITSRWILRGTLARVNASVYF